MCIYLPPPGSLLKDRGPFLQVWSLGRRRLCPCLWKVEAQHCNCQLSDSQSNHRMLTDPLTCCRYFFHFLDSAIAPWTPKLILWTTQYPWANPRGTQSTLDSLPSAGVITEQNLYHHQCLAFLMTDSVYVLPQQNHWSTTVINTDQLLS